MLARVPAPGGSDRKKLVEAAEHWAGGQFLDEEEYAAERKRKRELLEQDAAALGMYIEDPEKILGAGPDVFYLWPENVDVYTFFVTLTQWRTGPGGREGLDYPGVERSMRTRGLRARPRRRREIWQQIEAMERAAIRTWAERARDAAAKE